MSAAPVSEHKEDTTPLTNAQAARLIGRAYRYMGPVKRRMAVKVVYTFLSILPVLFLPWPAKILIDHVIERRDVHDTPTPYPFFVQPLVDALAGLEAVPMAWILFTVLFALLVMIGAWGMTGRDQTGASVAQGTDIATRTENQANQAWSYVGGIFGYIDYRWTLRLSQAINHHYRSRLFERIQRLPMARVDDQRVGDAVYRVMYDTPTITEVCYRLTITPIVAPIQIALTAWILTLSYGSQPVVIYAALAILPLAMLITFPFSGAIRRNAETSRGTGAGTTSTIEESINNILAVQSLGGQEREKKRFEDDSWKSYSDFRRLAIIVVAMAVMAGVAVSAMGYLVFYELTDRIFADQMTVGDMWVIFAYYAQIVRASLNLMLLWVGLQGNVAGIRRVFDAMDLPEDHQPQQPKPLPTVEEGFVFEDVGFSYPDGTRALTGASLEAKRGTLVALAGPAGAGKTTLAYMVPRFLWPNEGRILVDGVDLTEVDREDLRKNVAFVFQEPTLFDATIAENIRVGKADASDEELRRAAEVAGALEFIQHMPQGFDTPLGRNGGRLSVGQKQRLSIARALVRDAPVLVLDEPTAALDPETELRLVAALREASRDKLVIVIAHRLSTIRHADQILFLQEGQIRERGSHAELMAIEGGAYRRFVELQRGKG